MSPCPSSLLIVCCQVTLSGLVLALKPGCGIPGMVLPLLVVASLLLPLVKLVPICLSVTTALVENNRVRRDRSRCILGQL